MKAVYVGAGVDTKPVQFFPNIKLFYYFDGQPNSEFGIIQSNIKREDGSDGFSRPKFIPTLDDNMNKIQMKLINTYDNLRIYSNNDQMVYYYTNTAIPEHYEFIKEKIKNFDTMIVMGHDPDSIFLDSTTKKIHFIGNQGTSYVNNDFENINSITYRMHNDNIQNKFYKFSYLSNCNRIYEFNSWNKFHKFYKKKNEEDAHHLFNI